MTAKAVRRHRGGAGGRKRWGLQEESGRVPSLRPGSKFLLHHLAGCDWESRRWGGEGGVVPQSFQTSVSSSIKRKRSSLPYRHWGSNVYLTGVSKRGCLYLNQYRVHGVTGR